ncbi:NfeD family protein [Clostridium sp. 19966]|uniref:NfeD family protein n=1 Tax=Clostridium sp. 19966 TaxID=2768166 RepID=UPI0028DF1350|nr:NfeD family protein [Clostridium sp. 19966]MDT8716347.1 NfeD family protein [Clostridium sp. 19966]
MNYYLVLWIVVAILAFIADLITSALLFIWFSAGAVLAIISNKLGCSFAIQLIIFIATSTLLMAVGYPLIKDTIKKTVKKTITTEQGYVGRELNADKDINEKAIIKIDGIYWTVKNEGENIKKGERIKITNIEGNKIIVKKM